MDPNQQEALSHQHYGYWCVPLAAGIAVFNHPNGKLLAICGSWNDVLKVQMAPRSSYDRIGLKIGDLDDLL